MKILAIANAHALAHVTRLLEIAKVLRARRHDVMFAGHGKYLRAASWDDFATHELPYISVERVVEAVRSQKLWTLYREPELEGFIAAELALYKTVQPDLVLLDNRPSARTSADIAGIKTAAVLNVHMSNYRLIPFFSYSQRTGGLPGTAAADRLENAIERQIYDRLVMGGLNAIRKKRGLRRLYAYDHEEGDLSLLADIPEFNPAGALPSHACYVGSITWHNTVPAPAYLNRLDPGRPTAYFTLGSEGLDELVTHLGELARHGVQMVVATGAANLAGTTAAEGVFLEQYVNTDVLLTHCDLVCCHGGNGTLYQALTHGLPCIVVATHAEQHYGGKRIQELGLGLSLTLKQLRRSGIGKLVNVVRDVIAKPDYRVRAQAFSQHFKGGDSAMRAADAIEQHFQ
ncbi:MAG: nucleotide disphospho-sugar-binding domain-containing protein [Casimicrobiaceae bacterium]